MADVIRVLVVDDDPLVRVGLSMVLGADPDVVVVGEASDGAAAIEAVARTRPDVVLMDIQMPGMDGLAATQALRQAQDGPAVIVLTTFDSDEHLLRALRLGANGFLLKDTPPRDILAGVRRVVTGEATLSPSIVARLIEQAVRVEDETARSSRTRRARAALDCLTEREREVADAVATGQSNVEIGVRLYMSTATVKAYVSRILTKLNCANRVQIAILVLEARG